jgi:hypothetical protein
MRLPAWCMRVVLTAGTRMHSLKISMPYARLDSVSPHRAFPYAPLVTPLARRTLFCAGPDRVLSPADPRTRI